MSFCPNCGTQLDDSAKFCHGCGAPVEQPEQQNYQQNYQQDYQQQNYQQDYQQDYQQTGGEQTFLNGTPLNSYDSQKQEKPKKKFPVFIIPVAIGVVALIAAVIVLFTVVIPALTTKNVDIKDYVTVGFEEKEFLDGYISGSVKFDIDKMYKEVVGDNKEKMDQDEFEAKLLGFVSVSSDQIENCKKTDSVKVKLDWSGEGYYKELKEAFGIKDNDYVLENFEKDLGIKFTNTETESYKIKLSEALDENKITVVDPIKINPLSKIKKLSYSTGFKDYYVRLHFKDGEYKVSDTYTVKINGDKEDNDKNHKLYIKKDGKTVTELSYSVGYYSGKRGEKVEISISPYSDGLKAADDNYESVIVEGTPLIIDPLKCETKLKGDKPLTVKTAKENVGKIRKVAANNYKNKNFKIQKVYYLTPKTSTYWENRVVVIGKDKSDKYYPYKYIIFSDCYMNSGKFMCNEVQSKNFNYYSIYSKKLDSRTLRIYLDADDNNVKTIS